MCTLLCWALPKGVSTWRSYLRGMKVEPSYVRWRGEVPKQVSCSHRKATEGEASVTRLLLRLVAPRTQQCTLSVRKSVRSNKMEVNINHWVFSIGPERNSHLCKWAFNTCSAVFQRVCHSQQTMWMWLRRWVGLFFFFVFFCFAGVLMQRAILSGVVDACSLFFFFSLTKLYTFWKLNEVFFCVCQLSVNCWHSVFVCIFSMRTAVDRRNLAAWCIVQGSLQAFY